MDDTPTLQSLAVSVCDSFGENGSPFDGSIPSSLVVVEYADSAPHENLTNQVDIVRQTGRPAWFPGLRRLTTYGIFLQTGSARGGRSAYYRIPDLDGVRRALHELGVSSQPTDPAYVRSLLREELAHIPGDGYEQHELRILYENERMHALATDPAEPPRPSLDRAIAINRRSAPNWVPRYDERFDWNRSAGSRD